MFTVFFPTTPSSWARPSGLFVKSEGARLLAHGAVPPVLNQATASARPRRTWTTTAVWPLPSQPTLEPTDPLGQAGTGVWREEASVESDQTDSGLPQAILWLDESLVSP
ncbi:unnamed protein product [Boreogadus saida]